jgi:hypothetical protein
MNVCHGGMRRALRLARILVSVELMEISKGVGEVIG